MIALIRHIAWAEAKWIQPSLFISRLCGVAALTHLTFGSNAYVSIDRRLGAQVDGLLNADIS